MNDSTTRHSMVLALVSALAASCGRSGGGTVSTVSNETSATISGLASLNSFASSDDGAWIVASTGINQTTGVTVVDVKRGTSDVQSDAWMATDQAPFVYRTGAIVDATRGDSYTLEVDPRTQRDSARSIVRGVPGTALVRAVSAVGGQWAMIELYDAATRTRAWKHELPAGQTVSGVAVAPDGHSVVATISVDAGRVTPHLDAIVALDGASGRELWRQPTALDRAASDGADLLFFSSQGDRIVVRGYQPDRGNVAEIRAASGGALLASIVLDNDTQAGAFDDSMHAGFDGTHLWFFRYRIAGGGGAHTAVFPSPPVGRTTICTYAIYAVSGTGGRLLASATDPAGVHRVLVGDGGAAPGTCDVLAVLPTRGPEVTVLRSLGGDRVGISTRKVAPGG